MTYVFLHPHSGSGGQGIRIHGLIGDLGLGGLMFGYSGSEIRVWGLRVLGFGFRGLRIS